MEKLSLEAMKNASEEAFRYAVVNAINQLYRDMNVGKVWDNKVDIDRTGEKVASIDETQKITFVASAEAGQIDEQTCVKHKEMFEEWEKDKHYLVGNMRRALDAEGEEHLYKCKQEHTSQEIYPPYLAVTQWDVIDLEHAGTIEDPIPFVTGMEVFNGKYYTYDGVLYLCIRDSGQALYNPPSELVGIYFEEVTVE